MKFQRWEESRSVAKSLGDSKDFNVVVQIAISMVFLGVLLGSNGRAGAMKASTTSTELVNHLSVQSGAKFGEIWLRSVQRGFSYFSLLVQLGPS